VHGQSLVRYRSPDEDSARWWDFELRDGDIVISTRSKSGTTWMQMICALLVFGSEELPAPLSQISPWLDWLVTPRDEVYAQLAAQDHRRIIKTHTPLDGIPMDSRVTYVVVGRHPLDMAVSLHHQGENLDRERLAQLTGQPSRSDRSSPPVREWLLEWTEWDGDPRQELDSLPGVMMHVGDAWARRGEPNVVLVHYGDLSADLDVEMRRLAGVLGITIAGATWPRLVDAAGFEQMRRRADLLAPDPQGVLRDRDRFFRRGSSGAGRELLTADEYEHYLARVGELVPPDLVAWLHR
jgi:aryl sulfotransferase